jgi:SnoaL-like domain
MRGIALEWRTACGHMMDKIDSNALLQEFAVLKREVERLRDEADIRQLQYRYGYFDEFYQWDRLIELFADGDCSVEIGARGKYIGKARVERFYREIIAENRTQLSKNQIYNHLQLQMVITVDPDGQRAKGRSRALILGSKGEDTSLVLAEGVYENSFIKQNGVWKIQHMYWAPTFYAKVTGIESIKYSGVPASTTFPPDEPARAPDPIVGRALVAYHY